jgi:peptidoglycan/xylan/chitin deacetylase (PgdA/CDA1 family)
MSSGLRHFWCWKRTACEWVSGVMPPRRGHHVLVYHSIVAEPWNDAYEMTVSAERFTEQLRALNQRGGVVPLAAAGDTTVSLTFDDGFADNVTRALPRLVELGLPATLFVIVDAVGRTTFDFLPTAPPGRAWSAPVSWSALKDWTAAGLSIGLHGWDHTAFTELPATVLRERLERGKRTLEDRLGVPVDDVAYPYGDLKHFDARVLAVAAEAGFQRGYTAVAGPNGADTPAMALLRIRMTERDDPSFVRRKADGRFDFYGVYQVARHRLRR